MFIRRCCGSVLDVITLNSSDYELDTSGIAWSYDTDIKFQQVDGFVSGVAASNSLSCDDVLGTGYSDCSSYVDQDTGTLYYFWYPDNDSVQYLYETFGTHIISPIAGVTDEHFINWMRTAGLSDFRKFYGKIDTDMKSGDSVTFNILLNFDISDYSGSKSLVLTNFGSIGSKNSAIGMCYIIVGSISLAVGFLFAAKRYFKPRPLGDIRELSWNTM